MSFLSKWMAIGSVFFSFYQAQVAFGWCYNNHSSCLHIVMPIFPGSPEQYEFHTIWASSTVSKYGDFDVGAITPDGQLIWANSMNAFGFISQNQTSGGKAEVLKMQVPRTGTFHFFAYAKCPTCDFAGSSLQQTTFASIGSIGYLHTQADGAATLAANALKRFYQTFDLTLAYDPSTQSVTPTVTKVNKFTTGPIRIPGPSGGNHPMTADEASAGWNYKVELRSLDMAPFNSAASSAYHSFLITPWNCPAGSPNGVCPISSKCIVSEITPLCVNPANANEKAQLLTTTVDQRDIQYVLIKSAAGLFSHFVTYTGVVGELANSSNSTTFNRERTLPDVRVYNNLTSSDTTANPVRPLGWIAGEEPDFHGQTLPMEPGTSPRIRTVGTKTTQSDSTVTPVAVLGTEYTNKKTTFNQQTTSTDWQSFTIQAGTTPVVTVKNSYTVKCTGCVNP